MTQSKVSLWQPIHNILNILKYSQVAKAKSAYIVFIQILYVYIYSSLNCLIAID